MNQNTSHPFSNFFLYIYVIKENLTYTYGAHLRLERVIFLFIFLHRPLC